MANYSLRSGDRRVECEEVISLDDIVLPSRQLKKLARDGGQIERMRRRFEFGGRHVRVVLHRRADGYYHIEDGRHRVVAAKLAGVGCIDAVVVSR